MKAVDAKEARSRPDPRVAEIIRARRIEMRKTQKTVAEAVGISRPHMTNIELAEDGYSAMVLAKIALELNLSLDTLLGSPEPGSPGTHAITVTEEELLAVIAIRGLPPEDRGTIVKTLLRAGQAPKQG